MKTTQSDVKKLGTILGVWAHPDDETFTMGGLIACATENGQKVICVTATKGDAGKTSDPIKWPQDKLAVIREKELKKALSILGEVEHYWLDYMDGCLCDCKTNIAVAQLDRIIGKVKPDTIITFEPQGITGHSDHQTVSMWAKLAAKNKGLPVFGACESEERYQQIGRQLDKDFDIYFNIDRPFTVSKHKTDIYLHLSPNILDKKIAALKAQSSQTYEMFLNPDSAVLIRRMSEEEHFIKI